MGKLACPRLYKTIVYILSYIKYRYVKESSRWLIQKGRIDEAIDILQGIADENGKTVSPQIYESFRVITYNYYL